MIVSVATVIVAAFVWSPQITKKFLQLPNTDIAMVIIINRKTQVLLVHALALIAPTEMLLNLDRLCRLFS